MNLGLFEILVIVLFAAIGLSSLVCIIHCIRNKRLSDSTRLVGVVLIAALGPIGAIVYLFLPREPVGVASEAAQEE